MYHRIIPSADGVQRPHPLLETGVPIWDAQKPHPFVPELVVGTLDEAAFAHLVRQDYRYLLDYARVFAVAGTKARDEETMTHLLGVGHRMLNVELDLQREFAADYDIAVEVLERVEKAPSCVAYTSFLVRMAHDSLAEIAAAIYPCG